MSFVCTQTAQQAFLELITGAGILKLKLFTNDRVPSKTDVASNYTELAHTNYTEKLLTPSEWVIEIDDLTGNYFARFAKQTWTFTSSATAYGYYITDNSGEDLYFPERFPDAPVILISDGGTISVTPTIGLK